MQPQACPLPPTCLPRAGLPPSLAVLCNEERTTNWLCQAQGRGHRLKMPQQLSPESRQTPARGYKNICIKRRKGASWAQCQGRSALVPRDLCPPRGKPDKKQAAGKGDVRGEQSWGGRRAGGEGRAHWEPPPLLSGQGAPQAFLSQTYGLLDHGPLSAADSGARPKGPTRLRWSNASAGDSSGDQAHPTVPRGSRERDS